MAIKLISSGIRRRTRSAYAERQIFLYSALEQLGPPVVKILDIDGLRDQDNPKNVLGQQMPRPDHGIDTIFRLVVVGAVLNWREKVVIDLQLFDKADRIDINNLPDTPAALPTVALVFRLVISSLSEPSRRPLAILPLPSSSIYVSDYP